MNRDRSVGSKDKNSLKKKTPTIHTLEEDKFLKITIEEKITGHFTINEESEEAHTSEEISLNYISTREN